jgi:hypothetical protein
MIDGNELNAEKSIYDLPDPDANNIGQSGQANEKPLLFEGNRSSLRTASPGGNLQSMEILRLCFEFVPSAKERKIVVFEVGVRFSRSTSVPKLHGQDAHAMSERRTSCPSHVEECLRMHY